MRLRLPADIGVNAVTYGTPRVGNKDFVTFFDSQVCKVQLTNQVEPTNLYLHMT